MRAPYTPGNEPHIEERKSRRKPVIITWKKKEPKPLQFHCKVHTDIRLLRIKNKWICPVSCGPTYAATKEVIAT
jgi:hypothetical protein